jgi:hypothetical protein
MTTVKDIELTIREDEGCLGSPLAETRLDADFDAAGRLFDASA